MTSADEWLQQAEGRNKQALEQAADLRDAVASARGSARSADGLVSAVVAPGGALVSLELDERAMQQSARALRSAIVETIHRASADAAHQLEAAVRPIVGDRYDEALKAAAAEPPDVPGLPEHGAAPDEEDLSMSRLFAGRDDH